MSDRAEGPARPPNTIKSQESSAAVSDRFKSAWAWVGLGLIARRRSDTGRHKKRSLGPSMTSLRHFFWLPSTRIRAGGQNDKYDEARRAFLLGAGQLQVPG